MAHIPYNFIARKRENTVERNSEINGAETRREMAARLRDTFYDVLSEFRSQSFEFIT